MLAGFIWGFGHAGYPQQPFYIRGVEVGIGGVALGIVMLRWGILPTLVWHYSVDAMYSAMLLLRSQSFISSFGRGERRNHRASRCCRTGRLLAEGRIRAGGRSSEWRRIARPPPR